MDPSQKRAKEREFFDVHPGRLQGSGPKAFFGKFLGRQSRTVNLQPPRFRRYRRVLSAGIVFAALVTTLAAVRLFTKAEVQDFYPSVCLGTWENAGGASGVPENFDPSLAVEGFTSENSAIYRLPGSEVFCGGFLAPSEETKGNITNIALTFIWRVGELPQAPEPVSVVETPPSAPVGSAEATVPAEGVPPSAENVPSEESPPETPVPPPAPEPVPSQTNEPSARTAPGFFSFIFGHAFAQEEAVPPTDVGAPAAPTEPSEGTPPQNSPNTAEAVPESVPPSAGAESPAEEPIVLPPLTMELQPITTGTEDGADGTPTDTLPVVAEAPPPDENFLKVSYSVDGEAWFEIGRVNMTNWQNFTARLPVSRWDELKKLQISIQGIPTTLNPVPPVYLAGMFAEVNYELPPLFGGESDIVEESTESLPVLSAQNAIRVLPGRGGGNVFGAGERVEFDLDLGDLSGAGTPPVEGPGTPLAGPAEQTVPPAATSTHQAETPPKTEERSPPPLQPADIPAPTSSESIPAAQE